MNFVVLNYGFDIDCWDDGSEIGRMIEHKENQDDSKLNKMFKTTLNERWYQSYKENNFDWPHPNKVLIGLSKIDSMVQIDWMPEINYLGIYTNNEDIMDFLKATYPTMLNSEALQ